MEKSRYEVLLNNQAVIKYSGPGPYYFHVPGCNIIAIFYFDAKDRDPNGVRMFQGKRIGLKIRPLASMIGIDPININEKTIILGNYDEPDYAISFELSVNYVNDTVLLKLLDEPERLKDLITKDEREGIVEKFDSNIVISDSAARISYLIAGFIRKTLTRSEHDELDRWVEVSDENMRLFEKFTNKGALEANLTLLEKVQMSKLTWPKD